MTKAEMALLEKMYAAEIEAALSKDRLPFQCRPSKALTNLAAEGYIEPDDVILPGRFPITIKGYRLTIKGNLTYCMTCK